MNSKENLLEIVLKKTSELRLLAEEINAKLFEYVTKSGHTNYEAENVINLLTIFILSSIVGYFVVWRVTPALHTPLMSITNAISGIIVIGALVLVSSEGFNVSTVAGLLAIFLASINIFGGFIVTKRMLSMFEKR
ncbi:MAG: proton-translocating transhydrogenase family protein [Rickettsiaceae bacterium]|nr:proton-translocating transhydrogenase family protein [Rickettsiaceae bacterium]